MPLLLDSLNIEDMREKGFRLAAGDVYSKDKPSLKDAIVMFGEGCTGGIISDEGLVITNHHCGRSFVQSHSTAENNLLEKGFWATSREEELVNRNLNVTLLVRMENVTELALRGVSDEMDEDTREEIIASNALAIINSGVTGTHYQGVVKPAYFGREYYLYVYEIFRDVRLVGAPPDAIGRFGGDSDNWTWPRHTGDFMLFRIYADANNRPAAYSPDNVPYKPLQHLHISLEGIKEGDFTMVMGFPGQTEEYLHSKELSMLIDNCLPARIRISTARLNLLDAEMKKSDEDWLRYTARYVSISNSWKKWTGILHGMRRRDITAEKKNLEQRFDRWATEAGNEYRGLMQEFSGVLERYVPLGTASDISGELLGNLETCSMLNNIMSILNTMNDTTEDYRLQVSGRLSAAVAGFFSSSLWKMDRQLLPEYLQIYREYADPAFLPDLYDVADRRYGSNYVSYANAVFDASLLTDSSKLARILKRPAREAIMKIRRDPLAELYISFYRMLREKVYTELAVLNGALKRLYRDYAGGLMEMDRIRIRYPDANSTLRISYGKVEGYRPEDAISFDYHTTLKGIFEKENPDISDYTLPSSIMQVYLSGDYGEYARGEELPVCFIASNHTSGGSSGSPVLNADGNLIGINFDRNWEGTISDYGYNADICRNISVDIRYVLFVMDRVAGARSLIDELSIVR